jgi:hypothetical protein
MNPIITARCKQGKLVVTEQAVTVEFLFVRSQSISRRNLTGVSSKIMAYPLFGFGGGADLIFHGAGGEIMRADWVNWKKSREILSVLGF